MTTPNLVDRILSLSSKEKLGHPDVTYLLSLISAWSYSDDATLLKILRRDSLAGKQRALHIEHHSVQNSAFPVDVNAVLVSIGEGEVETPLQVLAFRGTEVTNFIDLLTDALVEPHPWPRGGADEWVHRGFFLSLDVLWPELSEELSRKQGYLVFTGHSLGGALAVLAGRRSCDDELQGPELGGVYTFGQPMVGGEAFVRAWPDLPLHRFVFHRDLVVRLPPRFEDGDQRYRHVGQAFLPRAAGEGSPQVWTALQPGIDDEAIESVSVASEGYEILPAFLTLVTTRAPSLATTSLELLANLPTAGSWVPGVPFRLLRGKRVIPESKYALDDHVPTYYVDVSRASAKALLTQ